MNLLFFALTKWVLLDRAGLQGVAREQDDGQIASTFGEQRSDPSCDDTTIFYQNPPTETKESRYRQSFCNRKHFYVALFAVRMMCLLSYPGMESRTHAPATYILVENKVGFADRFIFASFGTTTMYAYTSKEILRENHHPTNNQALSCTPYLLHSRVSSTLHV